MRKPREQQRKIITLFRGLVELILANMFHSNMNAMIFAYAIQTWCRMLFA